MSIGLAVFAVVLALVAVVFERRTGHIPNYLTLPMIPLGVLSGCLDGAWEAHGIGLVLGVVFGLIVYFQGGSGGGAVKLFAAVSGFLGGDRTMSAIIVLAGLSVIGRGVERLRRDPIELPGSPLIAGASVIAIVYRYFAP
ncbi:A24 family peptidase [Pendulispora rubella]|uniref:A24 family peptidase n=2 Tax=Pendulispora rubella TaxID=2741070 RepID=A0ABZ2L5U9_9BACT